MPRQIRLKKIKKTYEKEKYDEDDPRAYKDMPVPDKTSSVLYTKDKIDEFHDAKIASLLAKGVHVDSDQEDVDDEEEVMPLDDSESDEEEEDGGEEEAEEEGDEEEGTDMESDLEGKDDDDLPNDMAWGKRKKTFYDSEYVATKGKTRQEIEAEDQEEEEEAKNIQNRLAANLSEEDYDLNLFQEFAVEEKDDEKVVEKEERIVKDLKQMSQKEKMKLLKKESPELLELIRDFKTKLTEIKDELQPLVEMIKAGQIPPGKGADYLKTKHQLYLNYCTNISFYLVLKAKRIPAHNHPVIERLLTYRNLINELSVVDSRLAPQLCKLLSEERKEKTPRLPGEQAEVSSKKVKVSEEAEADVEGESDSDLDDEAALRFYQGVEARLKLKKRKKNADPEAEELEEAGETEGMDADAKRAITYEMAKNKGLTPKRKKIDRNPRVKHREKYRRAIIRRKGQVREVRKEDTRYSGELSGIRAGVKKSVKLK